MAGIDGRPVTRGSKNQLTAETYVQPVNIWVTGVGHTVRLSRLACAMAGLEADNLAPLGERGGGGARFFSPQVILAVLDGVGVPRTDFIRPSAMGAGPIYCRGVHSVEVAGSLEHDMRKARL